MFKINCEKGCQTPEFKFKHMLKLVKMRGVDYNTMYDRRRND